MPNITLFEALVHQPDMLTKVLEQLYKDTGLTEESHGWDRQNPNAYKEFHTKLSVYLSDIYSNNTSKFMRLLYRVDIPEKKYKKVLLTTSTNDLPKRLTDLVLNRILQKVITRAHFDPLK